jgi:hypothetical protein
MSEILEYKKSDCELLRIQSKQKFDQVKGTWIDLCRWASPHRAKWMLAQMPGERNNNHIVDTTHIIALRAYVAGFLEGNTSATRPWFRLQAQDPDANKNETIKEWLGKFTTRCQHYLTGSNFYHEAGQFYYDFGVVNTGAHYIDEFKNGFHFHTLIPGSYYIISNSLGEAVVMVREFVLNVKAVVDTYGTKKNGEWDWSNFSPQLRSLYEKGLYTETVNIVHIVKENTGFIPEKPQAGLNRKWISLTYEAQGDRGYGADDRYNAWQLTPDAPDDKRFLKIKASKRKPFIVGASDRNGNFEYGERGPTLDAIGLIKSLNKKAIAKDQALEHMLKPPLQGPANLRKSYISSAPNTYVPLDAMSNAKGQGLRTVFDLNENFGSLVQDVTDLRDMVDKLYYSDYLLYLSRNPKTRTAAETNAIVQEQQLVIGPNLQSLNWTYNQPVVDFISDWVLDNDPYLEPPPEELQDQFLKTDYISIFAQAQKAADLPNIERYIDRMLGVAQIDPQALQKVNLDKLADIYEDRLYLPAGLNNPQAKVDAMRQQAMAQAQQQQALQQTLPAVAGAAKDVGLTLDQK